MARALRWIGCSLAASGILIFLLVANGSVVIFPNNAEKIIAKAKIQIGEKPPYPEKPHGETISKKVVTERKIKQCVRVPKKPAI